MNDVVDTAQETTINSQFSNLTSSDQVIKSLQRKLVLFKQQADNMHASQKSLHEDLIALQDKYLDKDTKIQVNAFFDGFSQALLHMQQNLNCLPSKINEFISQYEKFSKNQWKNRQFLKERYDHYLNKIQALIIKQEGEAAKQNPNNFILSAGTGVGSIALQTRRNNPKFTRNNEKLKCSAKKYQDMNCRVAQELNSLITMRNGISLTLSQQLTDSLVDNVMLIQANVDQFRKKNESININQNSNRSNNGGVNNSLSKMKFSSNGSVEQEQLDKEITIRTIFKIPATMDLPVIRRRSIKITQDGQVKNDHDSNNKKEYDPVPFESSNPNVIIYLNQLVQQDKNIFDFEDFNNKDNANNEEDNSKHSNNNQIQDNSDQERSIERVYTDNDRESKDEEEDEGVLSQSDDSDDSQNIEICEDDISEEGESNQNKNNPKSFSQKSSPETAPRQLNGGENGKQKKVNLKPSSNNNITQQRATKNQIQIANNQGTKSKKLQRKIDSKRIFKYEQERKKQLLQSILIKENEEQDCIKYQSNIQINNNLNINTQYNNSNNIQYNLQSNQNTFNNCQKVQQNIQAGISYAAKQQISPQSSLPENTKRSQENNNQNKSQFDQQNSQRIQQNRQNIGQNHQQQIPNQMSSPNIKISPPNQNIQQQTISSPINLTVNGQNNSMIKNSLSNQATQKQLSSSQNHQSNQQQQLLQAGYNDHPFNKNQSNQMQQRMYQKANTMSSPKGQNHINNNQNIVNNHVHININQNNNSTNNQNTNINQNNNAHNQNTINNFMNNCNNNCNNNNDHLQFHSQSGLGSSNQKNNTNIQFNQIRNQQSQQYESNQNSFNFFSPPSSEMRNQQNNQNTSHSQMISTNNNSQFQQSSQNYQQQFSNQYQQQQQFQQHSQSSQQQMNRVSHSMSISNKNNNNNAQVLHHKSSLNNNNNDIYNQRTSMASQQSNQNFQNGFQIESQNQGNMFDNNNQFQSPKYNESLKIANYDHNHFISHTEFHSDDKNPFNAQQLQNMNPNTTSQRNYSNAQFDKDMNGQHINFNNNQKHINQGNTFQTGQQMNQQAQNWQKIIKANTKSTEDQRSYTELAHGSQTQTNQQHQKYYQQNSLNSFTKFINPETRDLQRADYNKQNNIQAIKKSQTQLESDSEDSSVLSLTLIDE